MEQIKTDIVVVGAGGGGLPAAACAAQLGKRVLVVEKLNAPGGNANFPGFPIGNGVTMMGPPPKPEGEENTVSSPGGSRSRARMPQSPEERRDELFRNAMEWSHYRSDPRIVRTLIEKADSNGTFLQEYAPAYRAKGRRNLAGPGLAKLCQQEFGVTIFYHTEAQHLRIKDGQVCGVLAVKDGSPIEIEAKAVILSTGGFVGNPELMERFCTSYNEDYYEDTVILGIKHQGDGVRMAMEAGCGLDDVTSYEWEVNRFPQRKVGMSALVEMMDPCSHPYPIWVTKRGDRFINEADVTALNFMFKLPHKTCYTIFDTSMLELMRSDRLTDRIYQDFGPTWYERAIEELKEEQDKGRAGVFDTLAEAAEFIGASQQALEQTVAKYNAFCAQGRDAEYLRPAETLHPLGKAPYYVVENKLGLLLSRGPIKVNTHMEVVTRDETPIPGLYAAGVEIGGTDGDTYAGSLALHSVNWAVASGRIAAESAAAFVR